MGVCWNVYFSFVIVRDRRRRLVGDVVREVRGSSSREVL